VFLLPVYSAELSIPTVAFQLSADKISASAADAVLNDNYIALVIAIIGLVASVISVILLVADRRKEAAECRKKEYAESRQKNNEKGDIS
jgi:hypothetical protein